VIKFGKSLVSLLPAFIVYDGRMIAGERDFGTEKA
jgi:hypothetical protein